MSESPSDAGRPSRAAGLYACLGRLDERLGEAVAALQAIAGERPQGDPFRGLYIGDRDVERLLSVAGSHGLSALAQPLTDGLPDADGLARAFGLSAFDLDVLLVALAPEIDLRYESIYAYLQDDVTRRRPSADLVLRLLCGSAEERVTRRAHLDAGAPLLRGGLLHLDAPGGDVAASRLAYSVRLDAQVARLLLGGEALDPYLEPFCAVVGPAAAWDALPLDEATRNALPELLTAATARQDPFRLLLHGPYGAGRRETAAALAAGAGLRLLAVDLAAALAAGAGRELFERVLREAWLLRALPYLDGVDRLAPHLERALIEELRHDTGPVVLAAEAQWRPAHHQWDGESLGIVAVGLPVNDPDASERGWRLALEAHGLSPNNGLAGRLASRLRATPAQMTETVAEALRRRPDGSGAPSEEELMLAAQASTAATAGGLVTRIAPAYGWDDIVLPDPVREQLEELTLRATHRDQVMRRWGFDAKLALGRGVNSLFTGAPGTGKTMAVHVIARATGLELLRVDLSSVVSKYIGETEKNLDRIFGAAEGANAILFFDEADALFGKRSEVRDAHDRYANVEISYLLQRMESYEGLAVLASNLRKNLDAAFTRRLTAIVNFPLPDAEHRRLIWERAWPRDAPLAADVDAGEVADRFRLTGGNIRNITLAAAFLAARDGREITRAHVLRAVRREYQKMGQALSEKELQGAPAAAGS